MIKTENLFTSNGYKMKLQATTTQISRRHLYSDDIIAIIKNAISNNELAPGERIVETRWAKKLGISQAPVREAIRELVVMGLVESRPYQGAFVKKIDKQEILDSYNVRIALETQAMQKIASRITSEEIAELEELIKNMNTAGAINDLNEFIELDRLFHHKVLQINGNMLMVTLWEQCKIRQNSRISSVTSKADLQDLASRHKLLLSALQSKDKAIIEDEVSHHFKSLIEDLNPL